jgi:TRAP-type C4-dicarboxylate transport system substrate-binding protein
MLRACGAACAIVGVVTAIAGTASGEEKKPLVMKITLPTINDPVHQFAKNFAAAVEKDTGGRIKGEVYPASQLGSMPRQIEGTQFGSIQCAVIPPEFFVGVDERFELMAAPGLIGSVEQGQRLAQDPQVQKLMLSLGAEKGLHGVALFMAVPSDVIAKNPIRHLDDFKGKKIRIFTSEFQSESYKRLGATPVAMTLGDVLPAIQQGAIDGAIAGLTVFTTMHYQDAAKFVTEINQPAIFLVVELNKKWFEALPKDLQKIVDEDAKKEAVAIGPFDLDFYHKQQKVWTERGGELIKLPPDEQSAMMETLVTVGHDVSKSKPKLAEAYKIVTEAAKRVH